MKALCTFLIFLLIVQYTSETCNSPLLNESITVCHDREAGKDEYRCCGIEFIYKNDTIEKNCLALNEEQYDNLTNYMKMEVDKRGDTTIENATIYCESNYIAASVLTLILLFVLK